MCPSPRDLDRGVPRPSQARARRFFESIDHPVVGSYELLGLPFRFASQEQPWFDRPAPTLGQHNHEVLRSDLGLTDTEIAALEASGVIGTRIPS